MHFDETVEDLKLYLSFFLQGGMHVGPGERDGRDFRELHVFPSHPLPQQDAPRNTGAADCTGTPGSGTPAPGTVPGQPRCRGVCHRTVCEGRCISVGREGGRRTKGLNKENGEVKHRGKKGKKRRG